MKFIKISIERTNGSDLYYEVPDDFDIKSIYKWDHKHLRQKVKEQLEYDDCWDESHYEIEGIQEVSGEIASLYEVDKLS